MRYPVTALAAALCVLPGLPAAAQVGGFSDVSQSHWAAPGVAKLASSGIIVGSSPTPLAPKAAQQKPAAGKKAAYNGNKPVTRYELAVTLYRFIQYVERADNQKKMKQGVQAKPEPKTGAEAVKRLVAEGYLPKTTPLAQQGDKLVTANQMAETLAYVIAKSREKKTPLTPDSKRDQNLDHPSNAPGT